MATNTLITAATDLTGHAAVIALLKTGQTVRSFAHREDDQSRALHALGAEVVFGDSDDFAAVKAALQEIGLNNDVEKITGMPRLTVEEFTAAHRAAFV